MLAVVVPALVALAAGVYAQSPREQLQQMVGQWQTTPTDNALRERIITLGAAVTPAPAIPEDARRSFVEGVTIVKSAKDAGTQRLAIGSFNEALKIAPWWGDAYYNLAMTQELTGQLDDAERSLKWFILSNPGESEGREAQDHVYAIAAKRKLATAEAAAKREHENSPQAREAALLQKVDGARFVAHLSRQTSGFPGRADEIFEIKDRTLQITLKIYTIEPPATQYGHNRPGEYLIDRISLRDGAFTQSFNGYTTVYRIRPDAQALIVERAGGGHEEIPRN
jgi:tetratricopeptide (TPR) repeat protein